LHILILWGGDILFVYAISGVFLLIASRLKPIIILILALVFYLISFVPIIFPELFEQEFIAPVNYDRGIMEDIYGFATYFEIMKLRLEVYFSSFVSKHRKAE